MSQPTAAIQDLLHRNVSEVIESERLRMRLQRGKPLRIKLGIDPTSHYLHLGHAVVLRKLRAFQRAGHIAVLVIGDFTARIGDPSGRDTGRPSLTKKIVDAYAETYLEQAGKILDLRKTEVHRNSEWLEALSAADIFKLLGSTTIQQLLAHETFGGRLKSGQPLGAHEILYPLLQGYDSVAIEADLELGGADQRFNVLFGREVQRANGIDEQDVMLMEYLVGTDGKKKMGKSLGNTINLTDTAEDMFGKIMSIPDVAIPDYFLLATDADEVFVAEVKKRLRAKKHNPRDDKIELARRIVTEYFATDVASAAEERFTRVHQRHELPTSMPEIHIRAGEHNILDLLVSHKIVGSRSEARRLVEQGGVRVNRQAITDWQAPIHVLNGATLEVGKKRFFTLKTS